MILVCPILGCHMIDITVAILEHPSACHQALVGCHKEIRVGSRFDSRHPAKVFSSTFTSHVFFLPHIRGKT